MVRQARLELARRFADGADMSPAADALRSIFESSGSDARPLVQSLLTLHVVACANDEFLRSQLHHENEYVRAWAIRMLTENWTIDDALGPAWVSEQRSHEVSRQAASLLPVVP